MFLLIKRYCEAAIEYDEQGKIKINMEAVTDSMLKRLMDQFDLWGLGFAPVAKKK